MAELFISIYASTFQPNAPVGFSPKINGKSPIATGVSAMGILGILNPANIPGQFSFAIIVGVRGVDSREPHRVQVQFLDPDGSAVLDTGTTPFLASDAPARLPHEYAHVILGLQAMNVMLSREGLYRTRVIWDDELLEGNVIPVIKASEGIIEAEAE